MAEPTPELRERVLSRCHQEMTARQAVQRRKQRQWRWSLATGLAALLLLNAVDEQRGAARIERIMSGGSRIVRAPQSSPALRGALRVRVTLLATLLRDPNAL